MKPVVLSLGEFPLATMKALAELFELRHFTIYPLPEGILSPELKARIRAIATEANRGASRALINSLPKLEIISCFGVGVDAIDLAAARERAIPVTNTPGVMADECADLAIGMMLASARQIVAADRYVRSGEWLKGPIGLGHSVGGKTVGVVGLGGIGRAIADRARAFRMKVLWHGPRPKPDAPYEYVADLVELAWRSDFLMVACKGGETTRDLISAPVIDALGPEGTLINVARGSVVDEPAMIERLRDGRLGFAALDVFQNSPRIAAAFLALPNVLLQPHHGSATEETRTAIGQLMIENLTAHFAGRKLPTPVQ
ncbi:MAG TPA: 2-hydroxyacid dehydrogenase [Xanthobacteraceae bacterium]|nr:2-hydroxyacid dehydrogenase [Xanthobacteraceae bacterium]